MTNQLPILADICLAILLQEAARKIVETLYAEADARDAAAENRGLTLGPLAAALE